MLIEHTTKRPKGSIHNIDGNDYHFKPNFEGAHVAEVDNPAHIQRFLSIASFRLYLPDTNTQHPAQGTSLSAAVAAFVAETNDNAGDFIVNGSDLAARPVMGTGIEPDEAQDDEGEGDGDQGDDEAQPPKPLEEAPDDVLEGLYFKAYDKKPHHKFSREKIIDMIRKAPPKPAE